MLKRIIVSTIGLGVLMFAAVAATLSDPPPDCFPFACGDPPCENCAIDPQQ